jgi:hypothetical protein
MRFTAAFNTDGAQTLSPLDEAELTSYLATTVR